MSADTVVISNEPVKCCFFKILLFGVFNKVIVYYLYFYCCSLSNKNTSSDKSFLLACVFYILCIKFKYFLFVFAVLLVVFALQAKKLNSVQFRSSAIELVPASGLKSYIVLLLRDKIVLILIHLTTSVRDLMFCKKLVD